MSKWSSRASDQFRWLVSKKKTEAVNAYLMKNNKGDGEERERGFIDILMFALLLCFVFFVDGEHIKWTNPAFW